MSSPEGMCLGGYYCNGSAHVPNQHECPMGHYCPTGSDRPIPCSRGYFAKTTGNANVTDCKPCSPGKWCDPDAGATVTERDCDAGYVCELGELLL